MKLLKKWYDEIIRDITTLGGVMFAILIIPVILITKPVLLVPYITAHLLFHVTSYAIKHFFYKDRPKKQMHYSIFSRIDASSFPSIHAGKAVMNLGTLAKIYPTTEIYLLITLLIIGVMYSRIELKKHDWKDVMSGALLALIIFVIILR